MKRDWAYYVQLSGLAGIWSFVVVLFVWFYWRATELRAAGDAWQGAIVIGGVVCLLFTIFAGMLTYLFAKMGAAAAGPPPQFDHGELEEHLSREVLNPMPTRQRVLVVALASVVVWAFYCWWLQLSQGLQVTGLNRPVFWGMYITNFVFFIGLSYGGTLVSAILRLAGAEWRRPITRAAEAVAVLVLVFGLWNILLDMGRPDRLMKMFIWGRLESPLLWDVIAINTYLIACVLYLYLPLIPDFAILERHVTGFKKPLYHLLAFGWTGSREQHEALERVIGIIAVFIIPVAVLVHSVLAWVFGLTVQPIWHTALLGPYFVMGAMYSGIAGLIVILWLLTRRYHLQRYISAEHFSKLGVLLLIMACFWVYFTGAEMLTTYYGREPVEMSIYYSKVSGRFAPAFWTMVVCCGVIPLALMSRKRTRGVTGVTLTSVGVVIGMWIERYLIVVPTLERPRMATGDTAYAPSFVELSMFAGTLAAFALSYILFTRLVPIVSIWEAREVHHEA